MATATPSPSILRLQLRDRLGEGATDGAWWPRSRDLETELGALVDQFPSEVARVIRAVYSRPDWDTVPRRVPTARGGYVKVGSFPRDDTHLMHLRTSDHRTITLVVVPPETTETDAAAAMAAARG